MHRRFALVLLIMLLAPALAAAQNVSVSDVLIDGARWGGSNSDDRLVVQLAEGRHLVQLRRQGYRGYSTEVEIRRGETSPLNVSLTPER